MQNSLLKKIIDFPITKMAAGLAIIFTSILIGESLRRWLPAPEGWHRELNDFVVAAIQIALSLTGYIFLYKWYDQRNVFELSRRRILTLACVGFFLALFVQCLNIGCIYLLGTYEIKVLHPLSFLIPGFIAAIVAGFIAELALRGIFFRIMEDNLGTPISLILICLLFGIMHANSKGASFITVWATIAQAGWQSSALFIYTRSLWPAIFFHFAWDFAEPAIFGGLNPGITLDKTLLDIRMTGPDWLTGGLAGPGNSLQSAIICTMLAILFTWLGRSRFKKAIWIKATLR